MSTRNEVAVKTRYQWDFIMVTVAASILLGIPQYIARISMNRIGCWIARQRRRHIGLGKTST